VVEVGALGAHTADVERQHRADQVGRLLDVVVDHDRQRSTMDLEGVLAMPRASDGEAVVQRLRVEVVHLRREEEGQPAVGNLRREGDVFGPLGAEVDGDVGAVGVQR
jgi:hypothetical protein